MPAAKAVERKIVNHLIEKATNLHAPPIRYKIKNKEEFDRISNKGNISQPQGNNSKQKGIFHEVINYITNTVSLLPVWSRCTGGNRQGKQDCVLLSEKEKISNEIKRSLL